MIPVDRALEIVLERTPRLPAEEVALADCLGRVLAEDVRSDVEMPPFERAAMDGYAVRAEDVREPPARLEVVGQVRAGQVPAVSVGRGQAAQVMTGAPVPPGADAVEQVEKTRLLDGGRLVELEAAVRPGHNVAPRGSEIKAGDLVLAGGETLDPAAIAVLAVVGNALVRVGRRPSLAVLVTGDELVDAALTPGPGRIRDSNGPALLAQARWAGAEAVALGRVGDDPEAIARALVEGLRRDVVVVSGGVSAGEFDFVERVFARHEVEVFFDRVAIKPGAPLVFGRRGPTLVFGLPGNPVSAQVTFDLFVRAAILRMQGARVVSRPSVEAELLGAVRNLSGRRAHLPARVRFESGRLVARPLRSLGSADVAAHARANALVVLEAERTGAAAGERAPAILLGSFLERDGAP